MKLYQALIAGLVACGFALAETTATTAPAPAAPEKTAKKEAAKPVSGTIVSVDAIGNTVIIKTKKGEDTLTVNDKTAITSGGTTVALADLKTDAKVAASYKMEEGKKVAVKISEKAAKTKQPATAPAPAPEAK